MYLPGDTDLALASRWHTDPLAVANWPVELHQRAVQHMQLEAEDAEWRSRRTGGG